MSELVLRGMGVSIVDPLMVFVGGQTADDRAQDIQGQTRQTLAKFEKFLAEAGTDKSRLPTAFGVA